MKCPTCNVELKPLVAGIFECPKCKKIIKNKVEEKPLEKSDTIAFEAGEWFQKNTGINIKYEVCKKGIVVEKSPKYMLALLICSSPDLPDSYYLRISWFKDSINLHHGMIKVTEPAELVNLIKVLEKFDKDFDDNFSRILTDSEKPKQKRTRRIIEQDDENLDEIFTFKDNLCPKCHLKMKKAKNNKYFECESCGEIVVLEDGKPIFDVPTDRLPLSYSGNFPVNFYVPEIGITFKWLMAEWKAAVIIYAKENPDKKWLRLYWWNRDLQDYINSAFSMAGNAASSLAWNAKKGVGSPNIYDKKQIRSLIDALNRIKIELKW
jgi:ribosomal protein L37AE/L43A